MPPGALLLPTMSYWSFFLPVGYPLAKLTVHALSYPPLPLQGHMGTWYMDMLSHTITIGLT